MNSFLTNLSLRAKILMGFCVVTLILAVVSLTGIMNFSRVSNAFDQYRANVVVIRTSNDLTEDFGNLRRQVREYWTTGDESRAQAGLKILQSLDDSLKTAAKKMISQEQKTGLSDVEDKFHAYSTNAQEVIKNKKLQTETILNVLTPNGVKMQDLLESIETDARRAGGAGALAAGSALQNFMKLRLIISKNDTSSAPAIVESCDKLLAAVKTALAETGVDKSKAKSTQELIALYEESYRQVFQINAMLNEKIDVLGTIATKLNDSTAALEKLSDADLTRIEADSTNAIHQTLTLLIVIGVVGCVIGLGAGVVISNKIARDQAADTAAKEERARLLTQYSEAFDHTVTETLRSLDGAANSMHNSAEKLSETAESGRARATDVSAAAEEASTNVQTVAAATEELSTSIGEISSNVTQSNTIAGKAVSEAAETTGTIQRLAQAAQKIGEVVALINDIASQTNLLALNATIEAARAGEAGKGFAIVASEVKTLANQTARATEEISGQITEMQTVTGEAVTAIERINQTISAMGSITAGIASAVEEQSAATKEISRNIQEAATGTSIVSSNMSEVNKSASNTGEEASSVLKAANDLKGEAVTLREAITTYLSNVRSA